MSESTYNDNVNGYSDKNSNVIDNDRGSSRRQRADRIAKHICRKMGNDGDDVAYRLYCKAAYNLSECKIWNAVELAQAKGRHPAKYLSWLLTQEIRRTNANRG